MGGLKQCLCQLLAVRQTVCLILTPLVLLPLVVMGSSQESRCAYVLAIMAVYWITEVLPLAATALLPIVLFPLLGLLPVTEVCSNYVKEITLFMLNCLTFAIAVESCNLHRRVALKTLLIVGSNPRLLMLGFMLSTWFLSMWINNTSATAMMIPIASAVLSELHEYTRQQAHTSSVAQEHDLMCKAIPLGIAYASNIGGTGSLSGTGPNIIMNAFTDGLFHSVGLDSGVNFTSWMIFALPGSVISIFIAWVWMTLLYFRPKLRRNRDSSNEARDNIIKDTIRRQYDQLGSVSFAEKVVIGHFFALMVIWLSRKPPVGTGWGSFFPPNYIGDSAAGSVIALSLFIFPAERPSVFFWRRANGRPRSVRAVLDWQTVQTNYPWGVLLLLGGGFTLAHACQKCGLSVLIGNKLSFFSFLPPWQMILVLSTLVAAATELTSNAATASLVVPILGQLALTLKLHPLYVLWPCTIAISFAFMLPVANPPNAIVFASGHLQVKDMVLAGSVLNVLCIVIINIAVNTWGMAYFKLDVMPPEFAASSSSMPGTHLLSNASVLTTMPGPASGFLTDNVTYTL